MQTSLVDLGTSSLSTGSFSELWPRQPLAVSGFSHVKEHLFAIPGHGHVDDMSSAQRVLGEALCLGRLEITLFNSHFNEEAQRSQVTCLKPHGE